MHRDELCVWTAALARITYDMQAADAAHLAALLAAGVCIDRQAARDMLHMVLGSVDQQEALQQR